MTEESTPKKPSTRAKVSRSKKPQSRRKAASLEAQAESEQVIDLPATGPVPQQDSVIETAPEATFDERAQRLAFMEEPVTIRISESTDQNNPEPYVAVAVNGQGAVARNNPWIPRGRNVVVKRKFVERLARARTESVRTEETRDMVGDRTTRIRKRSALAYPFQVINDPNPKGIKWLQSILDQ